jgi:hypothetical protein
MMTNPDIRPVEAGGNWVKTAKQFWQDVRERALSTFWQGAVPVLVAAPPATDWSGAKTVGWAAIVGGGGAILSLAKSLYARNKGVKNSASLTKRV